jgi:hypothetical protein
MQSRTNSGVQTTPQLHTLQLKDDVYKARYVPIWI